MYVIKALFKKQFWFDYLQLKDVLDLPGPGFSSSGPVRRAGVFGPCRTYHRGPLYASKSYLQIKHCLYLCIFKPLCWWISLVPRFSVSQQSHSPGKKDNDFPLSSYVLSSKDHSTTQPQCACLKICLIYLEIWVTTWNRCVVSLFPLLLSSV